MDTRYELGLLRDGAVVLMSSEPFRATIKRVEFYRDVKLLMLVYDDDTDDSDLMDYELSDDVAGVVKASARNILVVNAKDPSNLQGFDVPLVQVGV